MATLSFSTLDYYNINSFSFTEGWQVPNNSAITLYFMLTQSDSLGVRRFLPVAGSTVQLNFFRQRSINQGAPGVSPGGTGAQTISKFAAIIDSRDSSVYSVQLTPADTSAIISGSVQLVITSNGSPLSYSVPYAVKKIQSSAGC
jgi:hypothetical protein